MAIWENIPQTTKDDIILSLSRFERVVKRKNKIKKIINGNRKKK